MPALRSTLSSLAVLLSSFALLGASAGLSSCASTASSRAATASPATQSSEVAEAAVAEEATEQGRPLTLWQVSREGLPASYLFGTCHAGVSVQEALPADQGALLTGASKFVMEVDPATMDPAVMQARLMLPEGKKLSEMLGAELWAELAETFQLGPAAEAFDGMHPFALLGFVISNLANETAERESKVPMDFTLSHMAAEAGVAQGFLETLDQQLDLFLNWPMDEMIKALEDLTGPDALEEMKAELDAVLEVCRSGDESGLMALREESDDAGWEQRLLVERNKQWIPKLEEFFAGGSTFVAAGAGHMFGDDSVVELLRARGYTVERMRGVTSAPPQGPPAAAGGGGDTLPLTFLIGQVESQAAATLCSENMVPVQCHGVTPEKCRAILTQAVQQCASDLNLPAEVTQEDLLGTVQQLGPCVVPQFSKLLPPEQEERTEGCSEAYDTLN